MERGNVYLDYNTISLKLDALAKEIQHEQYHGLVILLRGGGFAGIHLAFLTGLPYYFLQYNRKKEVANWLGHKPKGKKILLVEDFAGSGRTLINSKHFLIEQGYNVSTLVVCKDGKSATTPDFICFDYSNTSFKIIFPWERHRINPEALIKDSRELKKADHEYERTLWDLNIKDIEKCKAGDAILILEQKDARHFPTNIPIVTLNGMYETLELKAKDLGETALLHGFTHVVLNSAELALFLSMYYPEIRVSWWNKSKEVAVLGVV